jgi:hypothetical protein
LWWQESSRWQSDAAEGAAEGGANGGEPGIGISASSRSRVVWQRVSHKPSPEKMILSWELVQSRMSLS